MTTSARELSSRLADLLRREHSALAEFLVALAEFDRRRVWAELGHASLFYFLHRELGLSKGAAFYRKAAAELIQRFPEIVEPLRDGRLCLTSVVELSKVMTPENRHDVLARFFHRSKQEAKAVSAEIKPHEAAPHREVVTTVRAPAPAPALALAVAPVPGSDDRSIALVHPDEPAPKAPSLSTEPLTADLRRIHVTVSTAFMEKLERARDALSHSHPGASAEEILEAGLDLVIERSDKRKGLVEKPRKSPPPAKPEHIPAHVRRAVWKRDGGKCQWPLANGGICGSTVRVEIDHVIPRARGGPPTVGNLRLLCHGHNDYAAREVYGNAWMDRFTSSRAKGSGASPPGRTPGLFDRGP